MEVLKIEDMQEKAFYEILNFLLAWLLSLLIGLLVQSVASSKHLVVVYLANVSDALAVYPAVVLLLCLFLRLLLRSPKSFNVEHLPTKFKNFRKIAFCACITGIVVSIIALICILSFFRDNNNFIFALLTTFVVDLFAFSVFVFNGVSEKN